MPPSGTSVQHLNAMAAVAVHDHNPDWVDELQRVAAIVDSLPAAAVRAVLATLDAFQAEDGLLPQPAAEAQTMLAAVLAEPDGSPSLPSLVEALHAALRLRVQREPPPAQAHAA